jgi:imidazolonepropionase
MVDRRCVDLVVHGTAELATLAGPARPHRGQEMADIGLVPRGAVAVHDGRVVETGPSPEILARYRGKTTIDAREGTVLPGFVDPHTHLVFGGTRQDEFVLRCQGVPYMEIARKGGGIRASVRQLRGRSEEELLELTLGRLRGILAAGTTTVEAKSGYGLSVESELKSLRVIRAAGQRQPLTVVPTFLGAHEVPDEHRENREEYVRIVTDEMIPRVVEEGLAEFCDVFCEEGVFSVEESRRILLAGRDAGLSPKLHAEEFEPIGGARLAAEVGAVSADHLVAIDEEGMDAMAEAGVIPVCLPGTSFFLHLPRHAPARRMIEKGMPVALATDFNPGSSMTHSMPMILTLACVNLGLSPAEAITAATVNAAWAISRGHEVGSLEPGKKADLVVWPVPDHRFLAYHFGSARAQVVVKEGRIVFEAEAEGEEAS